MEAPPTIETMKTTDARWERHRNRVLGKDRASVSSRSRMNKLYAAVRQSRRLLRPFREKRLDMLKLVAGKHYSEDSADAAQPVNLLEMGASIFMSQLAARAPSVLITTADPTLKPEAWEYEQAVNHRINEIRLERTLQAVVFDALFSMGIAKVGIEGDMLESYVDRIDLDDWVHDMTARERSELTLAGHRYRMAYEDTQESDDFTAEAKSRIKPDQRNIYNEDGDEKTETLSSGSEGGRDEYVDHVLLWDIWLPREQRIVTFQEGAEQDKPLREMEWDGPEDGPFLYLTFTDLPSNIMPLPPAATWLDMHILLNLVYRKLGRQAEREKSVVAYEGGQGDDAARVRDANDGEFVRVNQLNKIQEARYGGPDQATLAYGIHAYDRFSQMAGNLDALGGLGPQSGTYGQDQLIHAAASKRIVHMQHRMLAFVKDVVRHLAWYEWTDPIRKRRLVKGEGTSLSIEVPWSIATRKAEYLDFNFDIEPYSMQDESPGMKLQKLMQVFQQLIMPLAAAGELQRQNMALDLKRFLDNVFKLGNMQEFRDILIYYDNEGQQGAPGGAPRQAAHTVRENVRRNVPSPSNSGKDEAMMQVLMGAGNPRNGAAAMRPAI